MSPYPRYIAGAIWKHSPRTEILYQTIDQVRLNFENAIDNWSKCDLIILIAGMIVPGKYIGGTPISVREARELFSNECLSSLPKLLVGPWARFGCGTEGGKLAVSAEKMSPPFDHIITGDPEVVLGNLSGNSWSMSDLEPSATRESPKEIEAYAVRGASIISQHPNAPSSYIICEIETYRGCPRFLTGGCSFCVEPSYGEPQQRDPSDVAKEIEALYKVGVCAFRIGNQADLLTYGTSEMGVEEFPAPNPAFLENFFSRVRASAPEPAVIHIDNVNPGTIAKHPEESRKAVRAIMKHHSPGDIAAFGVESLDPEVIRRNNLKASREEVLLAVRILNEEGGSRPHRGLPHLLPGINLLYGLPGESEKTLKHNMDFLHQLVEENLIVRRINVRQVIGFSGTNLETGIRSKLKRNDFFTHRDTIRKTIDQVMIQRVAPKGTILRNTFVEREVGNTYLLRQLGTYPLLCHMPKGSTPLVESDVFVIDHGPRSLTVLPYPLHVAKATLAQWKAIPGFGSKRAARIKASSNIADEEALVEVLDNPLPEWLSKSISFEE